jgi:hypothetical protein
MEGYMPADFDDISSYHNRLAAHYRVLAQAALDQGNRREADYLTVQAVRYTEAAEEQRKTMMHEPGANRMLHHPWPPPPPEPVRHSLVVTRLLAALSAIRHSVSRRKAPFNGLSLH